MRLAADAHHADALAPVPPTQALRYLSTCHSAPNWRWWLAFVIVFGVGVGGSVAAFSLLGHSADIIQGKSLPPFGTGTTALSWIIGLSCLGLLGDSFARAAGGYLLISRTRLLGVEVRKACLGATLRAPIARILELGSGNVITRMTKDIDTVTNTVSAVGSRSVVTAVMFPFTLLALMMLHWSYAVIVFAVLVSLIFPTRLLLKHMPVRANAYSSAEAKRNNILLDTIRGLDTTRAFGMQTWARQRVEDSSWEATERRLDIVPVKNAIIWWGSGIFSLMLAGNFVFSAWLVQTGVISPGAAAAAVILVARLEVHIFNFMVFIGEWQSAVTAMGRAVALAQLNQDLLPAATELPELRAAPSIDISDLSFAYSDSVPVLQDINLELAAGSTTALVGASGAGKSTLANLIAGLLAPSCGSIEVGGYEVGPHNHMWLARQVTLITQEVHVFSGSLRQDLQMAAPRADDEQLLAALQTVGLGSQTALWKRWFPHGLDTPIGAGADPLAPEISQYIALARVALRNPPALILDEATSEAGSELAAGLEDAAQAVSAGRTCLVVAHRLQQAMAADRILVMEQGRIVEDGTHEELLNLGGRYAELFAHWQGQA